MKKLLALAAIGGLAAGGRHFLKYLNERQLRRFEARRMEVWEGEGGAVPVEPNRTAAQIAPRNRRQASPRGVG